MSAQAATYYWTGNAGDGKWSSPENWNTEPDGSGTTPDYYPNEDICIPKAASINVDVYNNTYHITETEDIDILAIGKLSIPSNNIANTDFTVTFTGYGIYASDGIEVFRTAGSEAGDSQSTLVLNCNVICRQYYGENNKKLIIHSGANVTIGSTSTAIIDVIENQGDNSYPAKLTVEGQLTSQTIALSNNAGRTLEIASSGNVTTDKITGTDNSVTNNGTLSISDFNHSYPYVINSTGTGSLSLDGASTYIWKGTVSNDWNDAANWTGNIPNSDDANVIIQYGDYSPEIKEGDSFEVLSLTLDGGNNLNIKGKLKIHNDFDLNNSWVTSDYGGTLEVTGKLYNTRDENYFSDFTFICNDFEMHYDFECKNLTVNGNAKIGAEITSNGFQLYKGTVSGDLNDLDPTDLSNIKLIGDYNADNDSDITIEGEISKIKTLNIESYKNIEIKNTISNVENLIIYCRDENAGSTFYKEVTITKNLSTSGSILFKENVYVGGDVEGPFTSDPGKKLVFNGIFRTDEEGNEIVQTFYPINNPYNPFTYTTIEVDKPSGSLNIGADYSSEATITNCIITNATETTFKNINVTELTIDNIGDSAKTYFDSYVTIGTLTDSEHSGNFIFKENANPVEIQNISTDQTLKTTGTITFENDSNTIFGTASPYSTSFNDVKHVAGKTEIIGYIGATSVEFGETKISHWIETEGDQNYTGAVSINVDEIELRSDYGNISFGSTIEAVTDGNMGLTIETWETDKKITFAGPIGQNDKTLKYLTVYGPVEIASGCTAITTDGIQEYYFPITLDENVILSSNSTITIDSSIDSKTDTAKLITFEVPTDKAITVSGKVGNTNPVSMKLQQAGSISFNDTVNITEFTDFADSGDITFAKGGTISNASGTTFNTTGTVSFGTNDTDIMIFGTAASPYSDLSSTKALSHTTGPTVLNGTLYASAVTLGNTNAAPATPGTISIPTGIINSNGAVTLNGELTSTNSISITADTLAFNAPVNVKNITMDAVATTDQNIIVTGNWKNNKEKTGTTYGFTATAGKVTLTGEYPSEGKTEVVLSGENKFSELIILDSVKISDSNEISTLTANGGTSGLGGKIITFADSTTQTINELILSGTPTPASTNPYNPLIITSDGTWNLICPGNNPSSPTHTLQYLSVKGSNSTNVLKVTNCTDGTGNSKWIFVGQEYKWKGGSGSTANDKKWDLAENWEPASIPGLEAIVIIPQGQINYPVLPDEGVSIGDSTTEFGTITIETGGSLNFNGKSLSVKSITNNGTVQLLGKETINGIMKNGDDNISGTVEYYGSEDTFNFVWDGNTNNSDTTSPGKQYGNLLLNRPVTQSTSAGEQLIVSGTTTIAAASGTVNLSNEKNIFTQSVKIGTSNTSAADVTLKAESTKTIKITNGAYANTLTVENPVSLQNITTKGEQFYKKAVTVTGASLLHATDPNKSISFNGVISGNNSLSVQATNINLNCASITTTRAQTYTGAVVIEKNVELITSNSNYGNITFSSTASTVNSKNGEKYSLSLNIPTSRTISFEGEVGKTQTLSLIKIKKAGKVSFTKEVVSDAFEITQATSTTFYDTVKIGTFTDDSVTPADNGNITFKKGGNITNTEGTIFNTTGTVTFDISESTDIMTFGNITTTPAVYANLTHETGATNITGIFKAAEINLGSSSKQATISNGTISATSISAGAVTINGANTTTITTSGTQSYTGDFNFSGNTELTAGNDISFASTTKGNKTLTLSVPQNTTTPDEHTYTISFAGAVGDATQTNITNLPSLEIKKAGNVTFNDGVTTNGFLITQADNVTFKETVKSSTFNITLATSTTFDKAVAIGNFTDETSHTGTIIFSEGGTINDSVTFNTQNEVSITGTMSIGSSTAFADFTHNAASGDSITTIAGTLNAANLTLKKLVINGTTNITTSGTQTYNGIINGTTANTDILNLNSNSKLITFGGDIGQTKALKTLEVTGPAVINCEKITTSGSQTYTGAVTLGANTELTAGNNISFGTTINGNKILTLSVPQNTTTPDEHTYTISFAGAVGDVTQTDITNLPSLEIKKAGNVTFNDGVTTNGFLITQADNVTFKETVKSSTFNITLATSTTFDKAVAIGNFSDETSHTGTIIFSEGGTINDSVTFNTPNEVSITGTMSIGSSTAFADFTHNAASGDSITTIAGTLNAANLTLKKLVISGTTNITTTGIQTYNGTINGIVSTPTDPDDILIINSNQITFGGNIGQTKALKKLEVTGPAQINNSLTFTADDLTFKTSLTSTTNPVSTLTVSNCTDFTNPAAVSTVSDIDFIFTGTSGKTTNFIPGASEYGNITNDTIELDFGDNAFYQKQNASFTVNSGTVKIGTGGFNGGNLIVNNGSFEQTGESIDSVYNLKLTDGSLIWDAGAFGGSLTINGTVTEGPDRHINYNKKNVQIAEYNTISGVFWNLTIADGITITNGGSIRIRKNFVINGTYKHNNNETILGLDMTTTPAANDSTEDGIVSNINSTKSNLGKVFINKGASHSQTMASDSADTILQFTDLVISSGTITIPKEKTIQTENLNNVASSIISNAGTISITKNFTDSGSYSGDGLVEFTGSNEQIFTPGLSTYKNIKNTSANPLKINGDFKAENVTIASGKTTTYNGTTEVTNLTISSAAETTFEDSVNITNFSDSEYAGNINLKNSGIIATATEFHTTGAVTIGDNEEDLMTFGNASAKEDFIHTAGSTIITGKLNAKDITLGDTVNAVTKIITGTVNAESLITGTLEAEGSITTTDLQEYNGTVNLTNELSLKSDNSTITFDSTITGAKVLSADSKNGTSFGGDVGTQNEPLTSLSVTGPATIGCSNIYTSGIQSFSGAVNLTTTPHTLTARTITFDVNSSIDGCADLAMVTTEGTSFDATVGHTSPLASLEISGLTAVNCDEITTNGNQHYKNAVVFDSDSHLTSTSGNLSFDSTVDGNQLITIKVRADASNTITFADTVGAFAIPSLTIEQGGHISFAKTVNVNNFIITKADNTVFSETVNISTFTDNNNAGNITFINGGTISDTTGTAFLTTGLVTLGDAETDTMNFGTDEQIADLIHIDGDTSITGKLNAATITLAETSGGPMNINNNGLFKILDTKALTYTSNFTQSGSGNTVLGGSFTGNGNADFATSVLLYGSAQADFGSANKNISVVRNLIINRDATDNLNINSSLSISENLVLYNSPVIANANISVGKDILILGSLYSEKDTTTGITNEYAYTTPRHSDWSQPNYTETTLPDGSDVPAAPDFSATLSVTSGKTISAGKNFYANGTELNLNGTSGQWLLKLPALTLPSNGFAEAYHSVVSGCKVICVDGTTNGTKARLAALECTDDSTIAENSNVEFEDFKITNAYTVRDNAIRVEFNQPIRYHSTTIDSLKFHNGSDAITTTTNFIGFYEDPDCQKKLTSDITLSYTDETDGKTYYYFYIKAEPQDSATTGAWNTDATGNYNGAADAHSSDRDGIHHTSLPCLDFPRSLKNSDGTLISFIITDIWGKRLNNYSKRPSSTSIEPAYGSADSTNEVADKTGPVLWSVRTGQELHTTYNASIGEASQHSYDSHNFLEFRYSEPVEFYEEGTLQTITENFQVTDSLGAIYEDITKEHDTLTFKGFAKLNAPSASKLKLYTGTNGATSKYMNALYRPDNYSVRLSIAGWTDGTVSDYAGNTYKKWPGYIEEASPFTNATAIAVTSDNISVKDLNQNNQIEYAEGSKKEPFVLSDTSGNHTASLLPTSPDLYSKWDLSSPYFTPLRFPSSAAAGNDSDNPWSKTNERSEAIGNTNGTGSTLDRIDFHFFDNTPEFDGTDEAEWFTEVGWCLPDSIGSRENLKADYTYAADIIGGARQFDETAARRTSGGIRLSTKLSVAPGFKYSSEQDETPDTPFATGLDQVHSTVVSQLFTGSAKPQHLANDPDGLYLGLGITDTALPVETTFSFSYDSSKAYLTDLAGNRLRNKTSKTIDRTPPSFDIILSPVNQNKIYIVFVKQIVTSLEGLRIYNEDGKTPEEVYPAGNLLSLLPDCFQLIKISENGSYTPADENDIAIDSAVPAQIIERYSDTHFTCVCLQTTRNITYEDLCTLHLQLKNHKDWPEESQDIFTSNTNARVTFIQDSSHNYMSMSSAHALSDFAVNYVNPLYAYSSDITEDENPVMNGLYENGSWAVHNWNADQNKYGTLPAEHSAAIVAETNGEETANLRLYMSSSPDKDSVSTQFNKDFKTSLRVWLPDLTDGIFRALTAKNNSNFSYVDSEPLEETTDSVSNLIFNIPLEMINTWKSGDQISFMFGITNDNGTPVKIYNNPYYDIEHDKYDFSHNIPVPLYSLRMHDTTDIGSLDLWSFRLKGITSQRGGVTILNNVINAEKGEKTVIKVDVPSEGKLNVIVMTLDGNIITYLHRGNAKAGENYFTWDGKNRNGNLVARGMYFIRVVGSDFDETRKVMVVK